MIFDLKAQEFVNRFYGFGVVCRDTYAPATLQLLELILDLHLQAPHRGHAWRRLRVDEHRRGEVAFGEFLGDMFQVPADLVTAGGVIGLVGFDLDHAAVRFEQEVMGRFRVRKPHHRVAAPVHDVEMAVVIVIRFLTRF